MRVYIGLLLLDLGIVTQSEARMRSFYLPAVLNGGNSVRVCVCGRSTAATRCSVVRELSFELNPNK